MSDDPFRAPAIAGTALLERLAERGAVARRDLPREAGALTPPLRRGRLRLACGVVDTHHVGAVLGLLGAIVVCTLFGAVVGPAGAMIGLFFGLVCFFLGVFGLAAQDDRRADAIVAAELARTRSLPFPVADYALWLASEQPMFDVVLRRPVDQRLFAIALRGVDAGVQVEWVGERTARVTTAPRVVGDGRVGDREVFVQLLEAVLLPLHGEAGIERIEMGGLARLSLPEAASSPGT